LLFLKNQCQYDRYIKNEQTKSNEIRQYVA
jgi:hypothetical protein